MTVRGDLVKKKVAHYRENVLCDWQGVVLQVTTQEGVSEHDVPNAESWTSEDQCTTIEIYYAFHPYRFED